MALKARLALYLALNAAALLAIAVIGSRLSERVAERIRLGVETRSVRKLQRLVLAESQIAAEILLLPSQTDFLHHHKLLESIQEELGDLEALPASPETLVVLPRWQSTNREFKRLLEQAAFQKPVRSLPQVREVLLKLRAQGAEQLGILKAAGDRLRDELQSEDVRIQSQIQRHWKRILGMLLLLSLVVIALTITFGRKLGRHLTMLEGAFKELGEGKLQTRLGQEPGSLPETRSVFESFDKLAERLQQLDLMKSQFYSMAAHDLRSPLNTIRLAVSVLREQPNSSPSGLKAVDAIDRKSQTMLSLTHALLDRFFIERGRVEALHQKVDVNQVLRDCAEDLGERAAARGQSLVAEPMLGDATLWCDPAMLTQVLDNLVGNAIKYSCEGDTIRFGVRDLEDGFLQFHVSDNGPGIAPEEREHLFAPFHRGPGGSDRISGWGLGLAICREFVAAHDGRIWCESERGKGCCFRFTLPHALDPAVGTAFLRARC
ncbi:MAG: HAMP domain-containing histidine kinase [Candidatus Wallbacteria bacterium]|nr:HAMP domain-containing histidine kinase [Candidatus Wallbacteria bacterium]